MQSWDVIIVGAGNAASIRVKFGYFGGRELSKETPLLFLVAPALHVHPATDTILRYMAPEIEWVFVGIDERWREGVRTVFRKRARARPEFQLPIAL